MREIKFRAWIGREWDEDDNPIMEMCYDLAFEEYAPINDLLANVKHLMQYTGLKDYNRKEIYEGDITNYGVVRYYDGAFLVGDELLHLVYPSTEIIGNIYETPELINKHT